MPRSKLELVHHQGVGWQDTTDHAELKARGMPLALTPEGTTLGVAEHTVLMILAILKRLPFADSELRQGRFHINALRPVSRELSGMTVGYVGMGRIAQAVAAAPRAPSAREASTFDPLVARHAGVNAHEPGGGAAAGRRGHACTCRSRRRRATSSNAADLARMKPGAYLVNTARGGLVDEARAAGGAAVRPARWLRRSMCSSRSRCARGTRWPGCRTSC